MSPSLSGLSLSGFELLTLELHLFSIPYSRTVGWKQSTHKWSSCQNITKIHHLQYLKFVICYFIVFHRIKNIQFYKFFYANPAIGPNRIFDSNLTNNITFEWVCNSEFWWKFSFLKMVLGRPIRKWERATIPKGSDTDSVNWIDVIYVELLGSSTRQLKTIGYEYILKNFVVSSETKTEP
jgi:hypothetical protein